MAIGHNINNGQYDVCGLFLQTTRITNEGKGALDNRTLMPGSTKGLLIKRSHGSHTKQQVTVRHLFDKMWLKSGWDE
jgi:hypothetical protein